MGIAMYLISCDIGLSLGGVAHLEEDVCIWGRKIGVKKQIEDWLRGQTQTDTTSISNN
jgi:hypothetical protein